MSNSTSDPILVPPADDPPDTVAAKDEERVSTPSRLKGFAPSKIQMLILVGTIIFAVSHFFVWWELLLNAPQYPDGLYIQATSYEIQDSPKTPFNDIDQVDGLNHYIGMMPLGDAAQFEMAIAPYAIVLFIALGLVAVVWKNKWAPLLTIPIILFPFVYLVDLAFWLWYAGNHLDETAAITLDGFTPKVLGTGVIAQFSTEAYFREGWYIAAGAAAVCLIAIALSFKRKPAN